MDTVRIGYLSTMYHTSHILKGQCWLEQQLHLKPQWKLFGTGPAMIEAFLNSELDLGYIGLPPAMIGIGRGLQIKCVAGGHIEGTVMIGRPASQALQKADDLGKVLGQFAGQSLGSPARGSIHDVILRHLLNVQSVRDVTVRNYPWADLIPEACAQGEIQAAVGTPALAVLASRWYGLRTLIPPGYLWPYNPSYGIVATAAMRARTGLIEDFLSLHERACNLIRLQPLQAARTVAEQVRAVDEDFVQEVFRASPRYCASLPDEYIRATMAFMPVLQDMGYLDTALASTEIFDASFITRTHPELPHYTLPLPDRPGCLKRR